MAKNITELKLNEVQNVTGGYGVVAQSSLAQPQPPQAVDADELARPDRPVPLRSALSRPKRSPPCSRRASSCPSLARRRAALP